MLNFAPMKAITGTYCKGRKKIDAERLEYKDLESSSSAFGVSYLYMSPKTMTEWD